MNKKFISLLIYICTLSLLHAQSKAADSVVINVGDSSRVTFKIQNQKDLQTLKQYDFQAVVKDLITKLEQRDTTSLKKSSNEYVKPAEEETTTTVTSSSSDEDWDDSWKERDRNYRTRYRSGNTSRRSYYRSTYHSINFDIGLNNYLADGKFPDGNSQYFLRPWGSTYAAITSTQRTRLARVLFLEWGGGLSWYNFKFQDDKTVMTKDENSVIFSADARDYNFKKSKLTACYLNVSVVPMLDFGGNRRKSMFFDNRHSHSVRFGVGPYAGYRVNSYSKVVYRADGDKEKDKNHDNFYLNNIRYGVRAQFGFGDVDLFFNYDLNNLFSDNKGPKLNAWSFGITL